MSEEVKDDNKVKLSDKLQKIADQISELSALELSELVKGLEDLFGVSAAAPVMMGGMMPASNESAEAVEEKSKFNIVLTASGDKKIEVIKAVREITGLGLAESKALVDGVPKPLKDNVDKAEAEEIKSKLESAGASVELQ